jgi:2-iminobutanoate/2-iminopropanoate deaminase
MKMTKGRAQREEFSIPGLSPPLSHYCDAVRFGNLLFISGIVALDEKQNVIGGADAAAQTEAIFQTMAKVLKAAGAGFEDVLKVTVLLTDVNDRVKINPVRQKYFGATRPASTLFEVSRLAVPGLKVEIEAVVGLPAR